MRNYFPKRPSGAPVHTLSKLYDVPVGIDPPPYFEAEYCLFCGRRRVAVARYRMICLVLETSILRVLLKQYRSPTDPNKFKSATHCWCIVTKVNLICNY